MTGSDTRAKEINMADVSGYCPMGCGETLSVMDGGHVTCRKLECPRPDAVSEILADRETEHLVTFSPTAFTVRHPLRERLDDQLMECQLHEHIASLSGPPVAPGVYRTRWQDWPVGLSLVWESVPS